MIAGRAGVVLVGVIGVVGAQVIAYVIFLHGVGPSVKVRHAGCCVQQPCVIPERCHLRSRARPLLCSVIGRP
jgi:hypothetical protein